MQRGGSAGFNRVWKALIVLLGADGGDNSAGDTQYGSRAVRSSVTVVIPFVLRSSSRWLSGAKRAQRGGSRSW